MGGVEGVLGLDLGVVIGETNFFSNNTDDKISEDSNFFFKTEIKDIMVVNNSDFPSDND